MVESGPSQRGCSGVSDKGSYLRARILADFASQLTAGAFHQRREGLLSRRVRVDLTSDGIRISFDGSTQPASAGRVSLKVTPKLAGRGRDLQLIVAPDGGARPRDPDPVLLKLIVHAFAARDSLLSGKADPITSEYSALHRNRLAKLSYLAPDIISAVVTGNQPPALSGRRLLRAASLPLEWDGQRQLLGFA